MTSQMPEDPVDRRGVAALLDIQPNSVTRYLRLYEARFGHPFPRPVLYVGRSPIWSEREVREWAALRPGKTGRPHKDESARRQKLSQVEAGRRARLEAVRASS